jgi:signal transduction histidine kinase/CheY-like chemotaxis protein
VDLPPDEQEGFDQERTSQNAERVRWSMAVLTVIHLAHVVAFSLKQTVGEAAGRWRALIVEGHAVSLGFSLAVLALVLLARSNRRVASQVTLAVSLFYLGLGGALASFDQLVTSSISPFVAVNIGIALMLRLNPLTSVLHHAAGLALFLGLQPYFQVDATVRFTNSSNAVTMAVLGALLSVTFSVFQRRDYAQRRTIVRQNAELEGAFARMQGLAERAEAANTAKSQFLATMSHEIRTPLNGVLGVAELLRSGSLNVDERRLVSAITDAGGSLLTIINDLLDFSKIEAGQMTLERVPVSVRALVEEVRALFSFRATEKGLTLVTSWTTEQDSWLLADPTRLRQVLSNLIGNALKFTERGGVRVALSLSSASIGADAVLECRVTDTGIGLTPAQQGKLFAPFVQADASTTRRFGGTGLGLAICKRLVEQMGGVIGVESVEGQGATFWFRVTAPVSAPAPSPAERGVSPGFHARALLAEDNPVNVLVARGMLTRLGVEVIVARDGREALDLLERTTVDLVFTDLHMPELDGFELATALRARGFTQPIVAVTANALPEDRQRCLDVGMNDYVSKPFRPADLERVLTQWGAVPRAA